MSNITTRISTLFFIILISQLPMPTMRVAARPPAQQKNIRIVQRNPVVNERRQIALTAVDAAGRPLTGVTWESGSRDVADVDSTSGAVLGIDRGFATITARSSSGEIDSVFVAVVRVESALGHMLPGDSKMDMGGRLYLSIPSDNVILRKDDFFAAPAVFAGRSKTNGLMNGRRQDALFNFPTAIAVDNKKDGVYVADSANHSIRKIGFDDQVATVIGTGSPGTITTPTVPFSQAVFRGPRGIASDIGGNLFIADTENHAIFYVDFIRREVSRFAGQPGTSGKTDGPASAARFNRPSSIDLSSDGRTLTIADEGNRRVRLIDREKMTVTTISSRASFNGGISPESIQPDQQQGGEIDFEEPQSVSFDGTGNIYVVDKKGVQVVTSPLTNPQVVQLAQPGVSFVQAVSVTVQGAQAFVLDNTTANNSEAVKAVSVGAPVINGMSQNLIAASSISPAAVPIGGGTEIVLQGKNFAPESLVVLGDSPVNASVMSATEIRFMSPPQKAPGRRTISVQTRGGVAQIELSVTSKPLADLKNGEISTIAGGVPFSGNGGKATNAVLTFLDSGGIALDTAGNLFIADSRNHRIRRVDMQTGVITTVAGNGIAAFSGDGGPALGASLKTPEGIAIDRAGNLFIADTGNNRVRKVDIVTGIITIVAGNGVQGLDGDGRPAINASLSKPLSIAADDSGAVFISDNLNHRIRRVDAQGIITTYAGTEKGLGGDDGLAANARLNSPRGISIDGEGNLFIADFGNRVIRRVDARGIITTIAGNGGNGSGGDGGSALGANLNGPESIAVDVLGNLYIADSGNNRIRKVDASPSRIITTVAGNGTEGFSGDGNPAVSAALRNPTSVAVDGIGNIFITDSKNNRVRQVSAATLNITTIAGSDSQIGDDSPAVEATLRAPGGAVFDRSGNLYIADLENSRIRRIDPQGMITTYAGTGEPGFDVDNNGRPDNGRPAVNARLNQPNALAIDSNNNLFIADTGNHSIRMVTTAGVISTVAGTGRPGVVGDGGAADNSMLNSPRGITVDPSGNLLIADTGNNRIRRVERGSGIIRSIAGNGTASFGGENVPAVNAILNQPTGIAADAAGNVFIADTNNNRIRQINSSGIIATVAGNSSGGFFGENIPAVNAVLTNPGGIVADRNGNIFFSDAGNNIIRRIDGRSKIISTVAGSNPSAPNRDYAGDNDQAIKSNLNAPLGLTMDASDNLVIIDSGNNAARAARGLLTQQSVIITGAAYGKPNLFISGVGFGSSPIVAVNGADVSRFIKEKSDTSLKLVGNPKKLNIKRGANQCVVTAGGAASNAAVFNF